MNKSKSNPSWFDLSNYDAISHDKSGLEQLAKLLHIRSNLLAAGVSAKSNGKYAQILGGDPLFCGPGFKLVFGFLEQSSVTPQLGIDFVSNRNHLNLVIPDSDTATVSSVFNTEFGQSDINPILQAAESHGRINVVVDLKAPTEKLVSDFRDFVTQEKERYSLSPDHIHANAKKPQTYFNQFQKYKVLQYLDLKLWSQIEGVPLSNSEFGKLLFPDYDSSRDKTFVNHTLVYAERALDENVISLMWFGSC
jgi:hypothetical protein